MIPMVPKRLIDQVAFTGDLNKLVQNETDEQDVTNISRHSLKRIKSLERQKTMVKRSNTRTQPKEYELSDEESAGSLGSLGK